MSTKTINIGRTTDACNDILKVRVRTPKQVGTLHYPKCATIYTDIDKVLSFLSQFAVL